MKKVLSIAVVLVAAVAAFAFTTAPSKPLANRLFELTTPSAPFTPSSWTEVFISEAQAATNCPNRGDYCIISVPAGDVYASPQLPKVDIQTAATGELQDDMITSLGQINEATPINSRKVFEKL